MYIRPVQPDDLENLFILAKNSGVGVTSLPDNKQKMQAKLERSLSSFDKSRPVHDRQYLFALMDETTNQMAGICALEAAIGHDEVWYNYHVGKSVHASTEIGVHKVTRTLYLSNDLTGSSEIATLFLMPEYRGNQNGQLLSRSRYMFLAEFPELFGDSIIAEMRGYSDDQGQSPFWESLGRHFFQMEFSDADYLTGLGNKAFIAELMPKFPIYVQMLSEEAQKTIGKVHPQTEPALAMLMSEGFEFNNYVDIFDAGPSVSAKIKDIRAVKKSRLYNVGISDKSPEPDLADKHGLLLVSNRAFENYRVVLVSKGAAGDDSIWLSKAQAEILNVQDGSQVRAVSLRPTEKDND